MLRGHGLNALNIQLSSHPESELLSLTWDNQKHSLPSKPQSVSAQVSASHCEPRVENKSVTGEAGPYFARAEASRNTLRVVPPCLFRRRCWKITSSGPLHPKATLASFDLQTALSSAICGFLCTLTPPAWIHPKKYSSPKIHILLFIFTYPPACLAVHCSIMWSLCFPDRFSSSKEPLKGRLFE